MIRNCGPSVSHSPLHFHYNHNVVHSRSPHVRSRYRPLSSPSTHTLHLHLRQHRYSRTIGVSPVLCDPSEIVGFGLSGSPDRVRLDSSQLYITHSSHADQIPSLTRTFTLRVRHFYLHVAARSALKPMATQQIRHFGLVSEKEEQGWFCPVYTSDDPCFHMEQSAKSIVC